MEDDKDDVTTNTEDKNNSDSNEKIDMEQMNDLIPIYTDNSGRQVVDGRQLHKELKLNNNFNDWIRCQLNLVDAEEGKDYVKLYIGKRGNLEIYTYQLTTDTAKEICMIAGTNGNSSPETKVISKRVRKYFIWCEKQLKEQKSQKSNLLLDIYNGGQAAVIASKQLTELEVKEATEKLEEKIDIITTHSLTIEESRDALNKLIRAIGFKKYNGLYGQAWSEFYSHINYKLGINIKARKKINKNDSYLDSLTEEELFKAEEIARAWANDLEIDVDEILGLNYSEIYTQRIISDRRRHIIPISKYQNLIEKYKKDLIRNNGSEERKINIISVHTKTGKVVRFDSASDAESILGIRSSNITACLKGRLKTAGGYKWYYAKDYDKED